MVVGRGEFTDRCGVQFVRSIGDSDYLVSGGGKCYEVF